MTPVAFDTGALWHGASSPQTFSFATACYIQPGMASKKRNGDLTTEVLVQIRDELRLTREQLKNEIHDVRGALEQTNARLERLEHRQTEDAVRLATEVVAVANAVGQVRDLLRDQRQDQNRIDDHERRIAALETKAS